MLQLEVVMVEKPPDKPVGWSCQPPFVEGGERHNIPRWQQRLPHPCGGDPLKRLCRVGAEQPLLNEALQPAIDDVGGPPQRHLDRRTQGQMVKSRWATSKHEETDLCEECEEKAKAAVTPPIYSPRKGIASGRGAPASPPHGAQLAGYGAM